MTLKTQMTNDLSIFFNSDDFAEAITYNGASINAIINFGKEWQHKGSIVKGGVLCIKKSDVASPSYWDVVVIAGTTWNVITDETMGAEFKSDGYVWELPIITDERPM